MPDTAVSSFPSRASGGAAQSGAATVLPAPLIVLPDHAWMQPVRSEVLLSLLTAHLHNLPVRRAPGLTTGALNIGQRVLRNLGLLNYLPKVGWVPVPEDPLCAALLARPATFAQDLLTFEGLPDDLPERPLLARAVLAQPDVRAFLDLFGPDGTEAVTWTRQDTGTGLPRHRWPVQLSSVRGTVRAFTEVQERRVMQSLRRWLRETGVLDEMYSEAHGGTTTMYLTLHTPPEVPMLSALQAAVQPDSPWTSLHLRDFVLDTARHRQVPVAAVHAGLRRALDTWRPHLFPIAAPRALCVMTARSARQEDEHLRGYLHLSDGRIASHLRVHRHLLSQEETP